MADEPNLNIFLIFLEDGSYKTRPFVSVHGILFRSAAARAARWLCVIDEVSRLLQAHTAACAARLLKYCERLRPF
jgi:threonine aldolase